MMERSNTTKRILINKKDKDDERRADAEKDIYHR
jgi:hypothetical protein